MRGRCPGPFQWTGGHFVKLLDVTFAPFLSTRVITFHHFTPLSTFIRSFFCFTLVFDSKESLASDVISVLEQNALSHAGLVCDRFLCSVQSLDVEFLCNLFFLIRFFFSQIVSICLVWIIARFPLDQSSLCTDTSYTATSSFEILTNDSLFM